MKSIVIYDIVEDKVRNKIADVCKDYGLERIQYSAFFGELSHNHRQMLFKKIKRLIGDKDGNIQIYPVCEKDLALKQVYIIKNDKEEPEEPTEQPNNI
jgi:CRISPR-associated protein Cas2